LVAWYLPFDGAPAPVHHLVLSSGVCLGERIPIDGACKFLLTKEWPIEFLPLCHDQISNRLPRSAWLSAGLEDTIRGRGIQGSKYIEENLLVCFSVVSLRSPSQHPNWPPLSHRVPQLRIAFVRLLESLKEFDQSAVAVIAFFPLPSLLYVGVGLPEELRERNRKRILFGHSRLRSPAKR